MRRPTPTNIIDDLMPMRHALPLDAIKIDGGTQMRAGLDPATVAEYVEHMQPAGWGEFPPVVVYHDGANYWLADGFHRVTAYRQAAANLDLPPAPVPAEIRSGTRRDAILYAAGANAAHGLRRTNADKRRAVETMLRDDEWSQWSDREIGRRCAVSNMFVSNVRKELSVNDLQIAERTVQRNGVTYRQNTANIGANRQPAAANSSQATYASSLPALDMPAPVAAIATDGARPLPEWTQPDPWATAWEEQRYDRLHDRCQRLAAAMLEWAQAWTDAHGRTWRDVVDRNPQHANSPFRQAATAECRRRGLVVAEEGMAEAIRRLFGLLAESTQTPQIAEIVEPPPALPADDRIGRARRLIANYQATISTFDEYGNLIGAWTETMAAQRELEKLIRHLEREISLMQGRVVEEEWA